MPFSRTSPVSRLLHGVDSRGPDGCQKSIVTFEVTFGPPAARSARQRGRKKAGLLAVIGREVPGESLPGGNRDGDPWLSGVFLVRPSPAGQGYSRRLPSRVEAPM